MGAVVGKDEETVTVSMCVLLRMVSGEERALNVSVSLLVTDKEDTVVDPKRVVVLGKDSEVVVSRFCKDFLNQGKIGCNVCLFASDRQGS